MATIGYADPPYIGQSKRHYSDHPDYAGEVDHVELLQRLDRDYDGWVLHCSAPSLEQILHITAEYGIGHRVMAWVKPFAAFKRNVSVAYAWEPVLVKPVRKPIVAGRVVMRDFIEVADEDFVNDCVREGITMKKGLTGVKPEKVCHWAFEMLGAEPDDDFDDMFPGTGAVMRAWESWQQIVWAQRVAQMRERTAG